MATLAALRLLPTLPAHQRQLVSAIGFAVPPLGNAALEAAVAAAGWGGQITNYLLPEDPVPCALGMGLAPTLRPPRQAAPCAACGALPAMAAASGAALLGLMALALARLLAGGAPSYRCPGRQVILRAVAPVLQPLACGVLASLGLAENPLVPLRVGGFMAMHRMVSYRARLLDLFALHLAY